MAACCGEGLEPLGRARLDGSVGEFLEGHQAQMTRGCLRALQVETECFWVRNKTRGLESCELRLEKITSLPESSTCSSSWSKGCQSAVWSKMEMLDTAACRQRQVWVQLAFS